MMSPATAKAPTYTAELSVDEDRPRAAEGTSGSNLTFLSSKQSDDSLRAITARRAGRINAASIKDDELSKLLKERGALVTKMFSGGLTRAEERRLALVRWNLDRIEDARHGETLDALEAAVSLYESIGEEIAHLMNELERHAPKGRRQ